MRILSAAILAAFFTAGTVSAYAQSAAPAKPAATKVKACSKRTEAECTAPDCSWTAPTGKQKTGKCAKAKK
jgi:hypothetical protein